MSKDMKSADEWFGEFNKISDRLSKTRSIVDRFAKWIWANVVAEDVIPQRMPPELSNALAELDQELDAIAETSDKLRWYFCTNPSNKWLRGHSLTREEFYIFAAQGIMEIPSTTGLEDAYTEFTHYFYEDNKRMGYIINTSEKPNPQPDTAGDGRTTIKARPTIGIMPEDVKMSFLRPEQLDFFKDFQPELFSRFRKD
jgi:hypothetical protein